MIRVAIPKDVECEAEGHPDDGKMVLSFKTLLDAVRFIRAILEAAQRKQKAQFVREVEAVLFSLEEAVGGASSRGPITLQAWQRQAGLSQTTPPQRASRKEENHGPRD